MYRISYRFLVPGWSAKPLVSAHDRIMGTHRVLPEVRRRTRPMGDSDSPTDALTAPPRHPRRTGSDRCHPSKTTALRLAVRRTASEAGRRLRAPETRPWSLTCRDRGSMQSPRVPNLVPIPSLRMERETPGQRPRPNYGHPHRRRPARITR